MEIHFSSMFKHIYRIQSYLHFNLYQNKYVNDQKQETNRQIN